MFLHRLEHGGLRLRRSAVDLVRKQDVRKDRAGLKDHLPLPVRHHLQDVAAEDVARQQIRRELNPLEIERQERPERLDQRRLADAGQSLEQDVPPAQDADQQQPVHLVVPEQNAVEFIENPVGALLHRLQLSG